MCSPQLCGAARSRRRLCAAVWGFVIGLLHITLTSEAMKPANNAVAVEGKGAALWRRQHLWKDLRQRLPLQIDVGTRISHCRVEACVTEPLADGGKIDACLEQMDRCGVPQRMRVDPFAFQCRGCGCAGCNVLPQEISNAESSHCGAALVEEDRLIGRIFHAGMLLLDQIPQQLRRPRPDGTTRILLPLPARRTWKGDLSRTSRTWRLRISWTRAPVLNISENMA